MRDTDTDWQIMGESEPYFGVLSHERFLRRNLTDETLAEFWTTGDHHIGAIHHRLVQHFGDFLPTNALDFGCGVGRLTRAMAKLAGRATGVDVSEGMLAEARASAPEGVDFLNYIPDGAFDWINTAIVFQHIPPERGYALFQQLLEVAAPECVLSVHFMLFKDATGVADQYFPNVEFSTWDGSNLRPLLGKQRTPGTMSMFDYDLNLLIAMLVRAGFTRYFLEHSNHGGAHGVEIFSRRSG